MPQAHRGLVLSLELIAGSFQRMSEDFEAEFTSTEGLLSLLLRYRGHPGTRYLHENHDHFDPLENVVPNGEAWVSSRPPSENSTLVRPDQEKPLGWASCQQHVSVSLVNGHYDTIDDSWTII